MVLALCVKSSLCFHVGLICSDRVGKLPWYRSVLCCDVPQQGLQLARDFNSMLLRNRDNVGALNIDRHHKQPSALLPPHRVVQIQLEALQMNDWPEEDGGCKHAYRFAVRASNYLFGSVGKPFMLKPGKSDPSIHSDRIYIDPHFDDRHIVKSWLGTERLENEASFIATLKSHFPTLIGAAGFEWAAPPHFRSDGAACTVTARIHADVGPRVFHFDLVRVADGAYKDCWLLSPPLPPPPGIPRACAFVRHGGTLQFSETIRAQIIPLPFRSSRACKAQSFLGGTAQEQAVLGPAHPEPAPPNN